MIEEPLELPCGATLSNRICKSAMTEGLAEKDDNPNQGHENLYRTWSNGGAAVHITGNVMVDRRYLERPGNVVIDQDTDTDALARWSAAATEAGNHAWVQINHPGRQCAKATAKHPPAPSEVQLKMAGLFGKPRAMTTDDIEDAIRRYAFVAKACKDAGFTGVQVHSAHGYLGSQFLSPKTNQRTDEWGGSLENRARFVLRVVEAVRDAVGDDFPVAVKLNSADFSKGGFSNEDSATVAKWLAEAGIDLLEVSGGTYEQTAFFKGGGEKSDSTKRREAYFLEYAKLIRDATDGLPLMVTGGFRTRDAMEDALRQGELDMIGIARPFCVMPDFPNRMLEGSLHDLPRNEDGITLGNGWFGPNSSSQWMRGFNSQAGAAWYYKQMMRMAENQSPDESIGTVGTMLGHFYRDFAKAFARR